MSFELLSLRSSPGDKFAPVGASFCSLLSIPKPRLGWQKGGPFDFADWDRRAPNLLKVL